MDPGGFSIPTMASPNEFPARPVPAVGAIVFRDGAVLLVKRGQEPNRGRWSVPGGTLEAGETVEQGAARETLEETGIVLTHRQREPRDPVPVHLELDLRIGPALQ